MNTTINQDKENTEMDIHAFLEHEYVGSENECVQVINKHIDEFLDKHNSVSPMPVFPKHRPFESTMRRAIMMKILDEFSWAKTESAEECVGGIQQLKVQLNHIHNMTKEELVEYITNNLN